MYFIMLLCAVISSVLVLVWLLLFLRYRNKYDSLLDIADGKIFTLKDLYFIGLGAIEFYERVQKKKITTSPKALEEMKLLGEVFGRNNAELYYYIVKAATISLTLTFLPIGLMLTCLMKSVLGLILGCGIAFIFTRTVQNGINHRIEAEKDAIRSEFPKMVSKLTLLVNAGMLLTYAWQEVAESNYEEKLYEEMRTTSKDLSEGMTIEAAMESFADRCGIKEMRKFSSIYVQAVKGGSGEAVASMKQMSDEAWAQKKQLTLQKGEAASQKLLIPNMLMFLGILAVVVIPMISSMIGSFGA
ncbi:MAG: type II secretion system F family protein [Oscillospiraceae bacterium]|nr:type II secretion system F family protein [Oscillospiraceae bacterium]